MKMNKRFLFVFQIAIGFLVMFSCSKDPVEPPPPPTVENVNKFLESLPSWEEFSPLEQPQGPDSIGPTQNLPPETVDVKEYDEDGNVIIIPDVTFECSSTPYLLKDNPEQIVMYSPDVELLWPGALIQGKSYRDGIGSLLGLTIRERTPIKVSIPSLANDDNFRLVEHPDQAEVAQAIGSMIGNATAEGLSTPSTITFKMETYHSEQEFALSVGLSGRYLGFQASATGDFSRNASETTITAHFYQKMFEVVVAPPQTPGAFFSDEFTEEKLQEQVNLGRIGPDNIPVYVSNVVYGRMMMFSFTSSASETDIRATLSAAYNSIGGDVGVNLSAKQRSILQEAKIAVTSLGGDAEATIAVIRSGNWAEFFTDTVPLTSAAPLSYTFRSLSDGSIAKVTEATEFNITECRQVAATPGTFGFLPVQQDALPIGTPVTTLVGDVNGDGMADMIWNHTSPTANEIYVGIANGDGTFSFSTPVSHPETAPEGWGVYTSLAGDVNGDHMTDLVWNHTGTDNRTYIGLSNGDGTFTFTQDIVHPVHVWTPYETYMGDVNGDGFDDILWNALTNGGNRVYVGLSDGDSTFQLTATYQDHDAGGYWTGYETYLADVTGDGADDIIWNVLVNTINRTYMGINFSNGNFQLPSHTDISAADWSGAGTNIGDVNGDGMADLVWDLTNSSNKRIYVGLSDGTGHYTPLPFQEASNFGDNPFESYLGDINGDGRADLIWNDRSTANIIIVGLGNTDGTFDFSRVSQTHPEVADWQQYVMYLADVNGDNIDDVIWNHPAATNSIYVGLAR